MDRESSASLIQSKPRFEPKIQTLEKERIKWIFPDSMDRAANLPTYFTICKYNVNIANSLTENLTSFDSIPK